MVHSNCPYCPEGRHRERIVDAAKWIADAPDERERNRRWGVIEALAGMFMDSVVRHIEELLPIAPTQADRRVSPTQSDQHEA